MVKRKNKAGKKRVAKPRKSIRDFSFMQNLYSGIGLIDVANYEIKPTEQVLALFDVGSEGEYKSPAKQRTDTRCSIGRFYEFLMEGIFGGMHHHRVDLDEFPLMCEPDVTDYENGVHREAKGVSNAGGNFRLTKSQTDKYFLMQMGEGLFPSPLIEHCVFLHDTGGIIKRTKGDERAIAKELSQKTMFMVNLPLSVSWQIYLAEKHTTFWRVV